MVKDGKEAKSVIQSYIYEKTNLKASLDKSQARIDELVKVKNELTTELVKLKTQLVEQNQDLKDLKNERGFDKYEDKMRKQDLKIVKLLYEKD